MNLTDEGLRDAVAQLWCLPKHEHKEMDVEFGMSIIALLKQVRDAAKKETVKSVRELKAKDALGVSRGRNSLLGQSKKG